MSIVTAGALLAISTSLLLVAPLTKRLLAFVMLVFLFVLAVYAAGMIFPYQGPMSLLPVGSVIVGIAFEHYVR